MLLILRSTITISWCLFLVLDTNNLLFWLYIHVPATIAFCFVVARITKCRKYSLLLPSSVIGERNGGVVALELKLVVSLTMPSDSAEIAVPSERVMASFNDVLVSGNDVVTSGSDVLLMSTKVVSLLFRSPYVVPLFENSIRTLNKTQNVKYHT